MDDSRVRSKMRKVIDLVSSDVGSIRTGRASGSLVEDITLSVYGGTQQLRVNEVATISAPDAQTIVIDPWDKSIIGEVKKGIESANVGLNPNIDGEIIRISLPPMTTEDREKYVKLLSQKLESGKVMVRQVRGEGMKAIKNRFEDKEITEDGKFNEEKRLQELTDEYVKKIMDIGENKKKELLQL
jgi:ribosome recycling factor